IQSLGIQAAGAVVVQAVPAIPRTETGKIRRQPLIERYAEGNQTLSAQLVRIWKQELGVESVGPGDSFFDLGGGPKSARSLIPRMEAAGVSPAGVQGMLDGLTVAEILGLSELSAATE